MDFRLIHCSVGCLVLQSAYSEVDQGINPPCDMVSSSTVSISIVPSITDTYIIDSIASNVETGHQPLPLVLFVHGLEIYSVIPLIPVVQLPPLSPLKSSEAMHTCVLKGHDHSYSSGRS